MFSKVETSREMINEVFNRYVESVFPSKEKAIEILMSGKKLVFYFGIDPTGPDIHLGHTTNLLLLKKIISLGHKVIILIGDFTAQTGDPTGRDSIRKSLTKEEVESNIKTYFSQIYKIIPKGSFEARHNSDWFNSMTMKGVSVLTRQFTVQQMIARDMFQTRLKEQKAITIEEFLYPLMQGYDSVAMKVDGEIGGNDQTFNMLIGRDLVKSLLNKEKIVITTKLLENPATGKKLMSKSEGQYISLNDEPQEIFGKVMALPDQAILPLFNLTTEVSDDVVRKNEERLASGENPKILKEELALELVKMYYGEKSAQKAQSEFERIFAKKELPENLTEYKTTGDETILDILVNSGLVESKSEAKRLIEQKAVTVNENTATEWSLSIKSGDVIKVGPRRFLKII